MKIVRNHKLFEDFYDSVEDDIKTDNEEITVDDNYKFRIDVLLMFKTCKTQEENVEITKKIITRLLSQFENIDEFLKTGQPALYMNIPCLKKKEDFSIILDNGFECECFYDIDKFSNLNKLLVRVPVNLKQFDSMNKLFNVPFMVYRAAIRSMAFTSTSPISKPYKVGHISINLIEGLTGEDMYEESKERIHFSQTCCKALFSSEEFHNSDLWKVKDYIDKFYTGKDTINIETFKKYILSKK